MKNSILLGLLLAVFSFGCTKKNSLDPHHKTLNYVLADDIKSLDPANAYDTISLAVMPLAVESLYQYSYLKRPLQVEPLLADGMPKVSKDKKTYTIKLKKGVFFQDDAAFADGKGRELKAQDFIYAWKRLAHPKLQSNGTWIFEGRVVGFDEFKKELFDKPAEADSLLNKSIEGLQAIDDYTIQVKLLKPYPQLLFILTMGFTAPMPEEAVKKYGQEGFNERMVGTGPFILKEFVRGSHVVLVKNPHFRGEVYPSEAVSQKIPFLDEIDFQIIKESQPSWLQFNKGILDIAGIPKDNFDTAIQRQTELSPELQKKGIRLTIYEPPTIFYLSFNAKDKLVGKNANLRRAIVRAIDRDYFIKVFLNGRGVKAPSILPGDIAGHVERKGIVGDYNITEAKKYLAEAGYPNGKGLPEITYDIRGNSTVARQQAEYIKRALAEIGVNIKIEANTFPTFLQKAKNGNLQFYLGGWVADYPDAENFFQLLYGKNISPGPNDSNYENPEFDKLYEQIAAMEPSAKRNQLIKQAEDIALNDAVWSMLYYPIEYYLYQGWVKNFFPNDLILNSLKYLDVDVEKKKELLKSF